MRLPVLEAGSQQCADVAYERGDQLQIMNAYGALSVWLLFKSNRAICSVAFKAAVEPADLDKLFDGEKYLRGLSRIIVLQKNKNSFADSTFQ